jgi:NADPH:quinone reductase-like Zn-dependent oxidoreductase
MQAYAFWLGSDPGMTAMTSMKAIRIHDFGGPEVLKREDVPLPEPRDDEVLVRIRAASVNPVDFKTREGKYPMVKREDLPITLGRDFSGTIESCGTRVQGLSKGDGVFALLDRDRGSYAQYVVAKAIEFTAKPQTLDHVHAAAVPLAALTAWQGLFDQGQLTAGQKVLIHGGAGGVGHMAVQLAKAKGAWVAATCSGQDMDIVRELGADKAIDYKNQRFEDEVSDLDLVYDLIGGDTQARSFAVLKRGGALISTLQKPDAAKAKEKDLRVAHYMAEANAAQLRDVARLIDEGKARAVVSRTFSLDEAADAQTFLENEHVRGKIVLTAE